MLLKALPIYPFRLGKTYIAISLILVRLKTLRKFKTTKFQKQVYNVEKNFKRKDQFTNLTFLAKQKFILKMIYIYIYIRLLHLQLKHYSNL